MSDVDEKAKIEILTRESVIRGIATMVLRSSRGRFTREEAEEAVESAMPSFDTIVAAVNLQHGQALKDLLTDLRAQAAWNRRVGGDYDTDAMLLGRAADALSAMESSKGRLVDALETSTAALEAATSTANSLRDSVEMAHSALRLLGWDDKSYPQDWAGDVLEIGNEALNFDLENNWGCVPMPVRERYAKAEIVFGIPGLARAEGMKWWQESHRPGRHFITRRFRKEDGDYKMLIDGGWCDMPMVPPCPTDPDGTVAYDAMMRAKPEPTGAVDLVVELAVRVRAATETEKSCSS